MNIFFVSNISWSLFNFRKGIMSALKAKGYEVLCCASPDEYTTRLEDIGYKFIPVNIDRKGTNPLSDIRLIFQLYNIYKKYKPDLIFHNSIKPNVYGAIAARLAGVRCVNTVAGLGYMFISNKVYSWLGRLLYWIASALAKKTFFQNKYDMRFF